VIIIMGVLLDGDRVKVRRVTAARRAETLRAA
jgi:hypothetical protein